MTAELAAQETVAPKLWRNSGFMVFWSARTISYAGTGVTMVVLPGYSPVR